MIQVYLGRVVCAVRMDVSAIGDFLKDLSSTGRLHHTDDFGDIPDNRCFPWSATFGHFIDDNVPLSIFLVDLIPGQSFKLGASQACAAAELAKVRMVRFGKMRIANGSPSRSDNIFPQARRSFNIVSSGISVQGALAQILCES